MKNHNQLKKQQHAFPIHLEYLVNIIPKAERYQKS